MALSEDEELELLELENEEAAGGMKDAPASPRMAADSGEALLSNLPTQSIKQDIVRGLPSALYATVGGVLGAPLGPLGIAGGAALGGMVGEGLRQGAAYGTARAFPTENFPQNSGRRIASDVIGQGVVQGAGAGIGLGIGAGLTAARPGINRVGAGLLKIAGGVPENVGAQIMENPSVLLGAPTRSAVAALYDKFHTASGTVSRDTAIGRSAKPSNVGSTGYAIREMDAARVALRNGTLTEQQAVSASQAGRIISDARREGMEVSQKMADFAQETKAAMDDFIGRGRGPRTEIQSIPVAQNLEREATPIASKLNQKSDVYQSASKLVPEQVNVPTEGSSDIAGELRRVVDMVKRAKGNGLAPKSIMTDSERALYDQFQNAVEQSAQHNVPIETLLTKGEMTAPVSGFAERTVLREGEPIYAGANRYEFGGTVDKVSYKPGSEIMGDFPVQVPAQQGFPEWQSAREGARREFLSNEMGDFFPQNKGNSTNVLRPWHAVGVGGAVGAGIGGPVGAVAGGALGLAATSPLAYRTALQGAALVGKIPAPIYRVGAATAAGATGSALEQAYNRR